LNALILLTKPGSGWPELVKMGKIPLKLLRTKKELAKAAWELRAGMAQISHPTDLARQKGHATGAKIRQNIRTGRFMHDATSLKLTRRAILGAFAATAVTAAPFFPGVTAYARGAGDIRKVNFYSGRTGESVNIVYWIDGQYVPESLAEISHFFRDWRNNAVHAVDTRTIDFLAATHNMLRVNEPYMLLSGYRSPQTNAMLRARSRNVAKDSLHLRGQAADVRLRSRTVGQIAQAAMACNAGGVGRYSRSDFVHFDCGAVRSWGR
jgi:uncharacterized protein YcbK (DUF882 family)